MEKTNWKVEGMTCSNCSLTVTRFLEKKGRKNVFVNLASGEVMFDKSEDGSSEELVRGIEQLGYSVETDTGVPVRRKNKLFKSDLHRLIFCLVFTVPLMMHMFDRWWHIDWLMNPWVQLALCLPVYVVGMDFFGRSALQSIRHRQPNMNVLIAIGSTAAFVYSLSGALMGLGHDYLFFETSAAIITLVLLGNVLEERSIASTQKELNKLVRTQKVMANMIAFDDEHREVIMPVENSQLRTGDLILIRAGEQVPADAKVMTGNGSVNEAIITGESLPVEKHPRDLLLGGSVLFDGTLKAQVTKDAKDSVLASMIEMVKKAQGEKPPMQQLADKISAIFVPAVLGVALLTFVINLLVLDGEQVLTQSLMRAIAVLVIACPCAMGLATPAAIAVGLGRAARNGVLFRKSKSLELFKDITQVVFDKTGTLTTGEFAVVNYSTTLPDETFRQVVYALEKNSGHPLARSIVKEWKNKSDLRLTGIQEIKGMGIKGVSRTGDRYYVGSYKIAARLTDDHSHSFYLLKNEELAGWVDLEDQIRPEAGQVISYLRKKNIRTILLSGDREAVAKKVAEQLQIDEVFAGFSPEQKQQKIEELAKEQPTAMVGDGINDAPALAKATIGISLAEASQLAMQTADVVLMNNGLENLPLSLGLGKHTYRTIKENLFWAFIYNIVAIPVAAFGFLTPTFGALVMGLSDVVLAANSVRLAGKKVV